LHDGLHIDVQGLQLLPNPGFSHELGQEHSHRSFEIENMRVAHIDGPQGADCSPEAVSSREHPHYDLFLHVGYRSFETSRTERSKIVIFFGFLCPQVGALKLQDLSLAEEIGIIDSTLSCLVSWLEGHSLAQTVFTNLYLHKPHHIEDRIMKAFSISIFKIVDIIKDFVNR
jgi:hypothetical protein